MNEQKAKVPTSQLTFPNAENTTTNQINNLLTIGSFALHALLRPDGGQNLHRADFPKEAEIAAENTFVKVLENFDEILSDKSRWSLDTQKHLAQRFEDAHTLNLKYLDEQAKFAAEMNTPHFRFKPALMRLKDGRMLAILGHVEDLDNAIVGVGGSAEEALHLFDETFTHGVPIAVAQYLQRREEALEKGQTPEPYPTTKTNEKTVDARRDPNPPATKSRRKKLQ